jgi:hypothetical protein
MVLNQKKKIIKMLIMVMVSFFNLDPPVAGALWSPDIYNSVGKFRYCNKNIFYGEDFDYTLRCKIKGYTVAVLKYIKCYHATGAYFNNGYTEIYNNKMKQLNSSDFDWHKLKRTFFYFIFEFKSFLKNIVRNND